MHPLRKKIVTCNPDQVENWNFNRLENTLVFKSQKIVSNAQGSDFCWLEFAIKINVWRQMYTLRKKFVTLNPDQVENWNLLSLKTL